MNCPILKRIRIAAFAMALFFLGCSGAVTGEKNQPPTLASGDPFADIVNPLDSTCYDWRGSPIPCRLKQPYAELLLDKSSPDSRFIDNDDGTVTDKLTKLVWLKNLNCFGRVDWKGAAVATKTLRDGDCGPNPSMVLSDGSRAGDWRLPTMGELCTMIDFGKRNPALPEDHLFSNIPSGYHWSATILDHHSEMVWIVYFESGTTCYENKKNRAGYVWPVRGPLD